MRMLILLQHIRELAAFFETKTETELLCSEVIHGLCYGVERLAGSADPLVRTR